MPPRPTTSSPPPPGDTCPRHVRDMSCRRTCPSERSGSTARRCGRPPPPPSRRSSGAVSGCCRTVRTAAASSSLSSERRARSRATSGRFGPVRSRPSLSPPPPQGARATGAAAARAASLLAGGHCRRGRCGSAGRRRRKRRRWRRKRRSQQHSLRARPARRLGAPRQDHPQAGRQGAQSAAVPLAAARGAPPLQAEPRSPPPAPPQPGYARPPLRPLFARTPPAVTVGSVSSQPLAVRRPPICTDGAGGPGGLHDSGLRALRNGRGSLEDEYSSRHRHAMRRVHRPPSYSLPPLGSPYSRRGARQPAARGARRCARLLPPPRRCGRALAIRAHRHRAEAARRRAAAEGMTVVCGGENGGAAGCREEPHAPPLCSDLCRERMMRCQKNH